MDPLYFITYNGQEMIFNKNTNVVIIELREKFHYAGRIFNWDSKYEMEAFGINTKIIQFVLGTKSRLLINFNSSETKEMFWIKWNTIKDFINKNNNVKNLESNVRLNNIPVNLFVPKPFFSGVSM